MFFANSSLKRHQ